MFIFQVLILCLMAPLWASTEVITRIHDIDFGERKNDHVLLFLDSGHVVKPGKSKTLSIESSREKWWKFRLDDEHRILEMTEVNGLSDIKSSSAYEEGYEPSVIKGGKAGDYFQESRISRGDTQCYNRAHVWAFELWKKYQVKSQKIFLFFTRKFIREHNFGWWFHVAPMVVVKEWLGGTSEKVMDPRYITAPRGIDWWIGKFISGSPECPVITKYSEYADYPYSKDCYILKAPMYIYQPLDLEMLEVWGVQKNEFMLTDLQWAYKEAFKMDYSGE
jgi:hypothetical protein